MARSPRKSSLKIPAWLPTALSSAALIVSIVAVSISTLGYHQSGLYSEIAIRPNIITAGFLFSEENSKIVLHNSGAGRAILTGYDIDYDGKKLTSEQFDLSFKQYIDQKNLFEGVSSICSLYFSRVLKGVWIDPGEQIPFLQSTGECDETVYMPFLLKTVIVFSYVSDSGQLYQTEFRSVGNRNELEKHFK